MKIGLDQPDDSAYFNLNTWFIILITKVLQKEIAKLGHFLLAFVLGRRIESGPEGMFSGVETLARYFFSPPTTTVPRLLLSSWN